MSARARYTRAGVRKPSKAWQRTSTFTWAMGSTAQVRRTGGGGKALIRWAAIVDGTQVGSSDSPWGAMLVAEDEATGRQV